MGNINKNEFESGAVTKNDVVSFAQKKYENELKIGDIVDGTVSAIKSFGAFVDLPVGKSGLVHISEVAQCFVKDINEFLISGQNVTVKVLNITQDGKIALSIRQANPENSEHREFDKNAGFNKFSKVSGGNLAQSLQPKKDIINNNILDGKSKMNTMFPNVTRLNNSGLSRDAQNCSFVQNSQKFDSRFENMMNNFKKNSDDRLTQLNERNDRKGRR
ncbi:MAG: S1 RNA-binding domain-containing protein [Candidatus Improbicoccus devescovinae]|nr:MAG: S1 RNA-binding domain-containing protein [Candidatus Improbicoccus devescovinae]